MTLTANAKHNPSPSPDYPDLNLKFRFDRDFPEPKLENVKLSSTGIEIKDADKFKDVEIDKSFEQAFKDRAGTYYLKEAGPYLVPYERVGDKPHPGFNPKTPGWEQKLIDAMPLGGASGASPSGAGTTTKPFPADLEKKILDLEKELAKSKSETKEANERVTKTINDLSEREAKAAAKDLDATRKQQAAEIKIAGADADKQAAVKQVQDSMGRTITDLQTKLDKLERATRDMHVSTEGLRVLPSTPENIEKSKDADLLKRHGFYLRDSDTKRGEHVWSNKQALENAVMGTVNVDGVNVISFPTYAYLVAGEKLLRNKEAPMWMAKDADTAYNMYKEYVAYHKIWESTNRLKP